MTLWGLTNIHETANITLESMDNIFGVRTFNEYIRYVWMNIKYTFYYGGKTMYEFTHGVDVIVPNENDIGCTTCN